MVMTVNKRDRGRRISGVGRLVPGEAGLDFSMENAALA